MAIAKHDELPQIKLNGKDIDLNNLPFCRKVEIVKEIGHCNVVKIELVGHITEIKPVIDSDITEIIVIDYMMKKKTKFRAINIIDEDMED